MALIGKIRSNPLLVLLFIGGGIALFVLSDIMNSGNSGPIGPAEAMMARVGEVEIERNEFERTLQVAGNQGDVYQSRDALWRYYLSESLIRNETEEIGLAVTNPELEELTFGPRYSPVIRQNYSNRQTGQINQEQLNYFRQRIQDNTIQEGIEAGELPPNFVDIWKFQNRQVATNRLQQKLTALVSKAMYAPSWQAQNYADAQGANRAAALIRVPFDELDNDAVEVTEADLEEYLRDNRSTYTSVEETRQIAYVTFPVEPTPADSAAVRELMNELAREWRQTRPEGDSLFALTAGGSYSGTYVAEDQLVPSAADELLNEVGIGEVYGPFQEGQLSVLAKVIDRRDVPNTVTLRRIVQPVSNALQQAETGALLDSLQEVLAENDDDFSTLAATYNRDPRSLATDGVLEDVEPGQLDPAVEELAFIDGEIGEWYRVGTPAGLQLLQVVSRSEESTTRVKVAYATEPMIPSSETEDAVRAEAEEFLSGKTELEILKSAAQNAGFDVSISEPLTVGAFRIGELGTGQDIRDIVCWAFGSDVGEVSGFVYTSTDPNFYYESTYILVGVENILPEGMAPLDAVREQITPLVRNQLKGEQLAERLRGMDLAAAAGEFDVPVDTLSSVNLTLRNLPQGIGNEPAVVAAASEGTTGQVSEPIVGNRGVYLVKPLTEAPTGMSGNLPVARTSINTSSRTRVNQQLLEGLRAAVDVEDQRVATECSNRR
jgi:peptidyl-prolyl cis-trans isomerase D